MYRSVPLKLVSRYVTPLVVSEVHGPARMKELEWNRRLLKTDIEFDEMLSTLRQVAQTSGLRKATVPMRYAISARIKKVQRERRNTVYKCTDKSIKMLEDCEAFLDGLGPIPKYKLKVIAPIHGIDTKDVSCQVREKSLAPLVPPLVISVRRNSGDSSTQSDVVPRDSSRPDSGFSNRSEDSDVGSSNPPSLGDAYSVKKNLSFVEMVGIKPRADKVAFVINKRMHSSEVGAETILMKFHHEELLGESYDATIPVPKINKNFPPFLNKPGDRLVIVEEKVLIDNFAEGARALEKVEKADAELDELRRVIADLRADKERLLTEVDNKQKFIGLLMSNQVSLAEQDANPDIQEIESDDEPDGMQIDLQAEDSEHVGLSE
jgi:hypothetical protein